MFFSKEILQQDSSILYDDKEIIEALQDYYKNIIKQEASEDKERDKAFRIILRYCHKQYKNHLISSLEQNFYDHFILTYMPRYSLTLTEKEMRSLFNEMGRVLEFINTYHGMDLYHEYRKSLTTNLDEALRIFYITRNIQRHTESPVLCLNPMIIDMKCYKQKKSHNQISKREVFEQGLFEIIDKIGGIVILRSLRSPSGSSYIKIKVENSLANHMHSKDVLNMRIKKRFFYSTWDIIHMKDYYSYKAYDHIKASF